MAWITCELLKIIVVGNSVNFVCLNLITFRCIL